jgi:hypothetical protein
MTGAIGPARQHMRHPKDAVPDRMTAPRSHTELPLIGRTARRGPLRARHSRWRLVSAAEECVRASHPAQMIDSAAERSGSR